MKVKFWGVRGSIPVPGNSTVKYGGNTPCIEVRLNDERLIIIDAGTGIRELGLSLLPKGKIEAIILLSHTHWDHIHGFPFFVPAFIPGNKLTIYGPVNYNEKLEEVVAGQMKYSYFPVKLDWMGADKKFVDLKEGIYEIDGIRITAQILNHPIITMGYRIEADGKVFVTEYDTEPYRNVFEDKGGFFDDEEDIVDSKGQEEPDPIVEEMNQRIVNFASNADLLVFDAQYTEAEFPKKIGWGHSTPELAMKVAKEAKVKRLALFHHEPVRNDEQMESIENECKNKIKNEHLSFEVFAAKEKEEIIL